MKSFVRTTVAIAAVSSFGLTAMAKPDTDTGNGTDAIIKLTEPAHPSLIWATEFSGLWNSTALSALGPNTSSTAEYFKVDGYTDKQLPGDEGTSYLALTESGSSDISDILKLVVSTDTSTDNKKISHVVFEMWSGDGTGADLTAFNSAKTEALASSNYHTTPETGSLQSVVGSPTLLFPDNSGKLQIWVSSQEEVDNELPPNNVPTPDSGATVMLLGVACAGIASARRFVK